MLVFLKDTAPTFFRQFFYAVRHTMLPKGVIVMLKAWIVRHQIKKTLNETWKNPEGSAARQEMFPNGKPTPEEFIQTIAEIVKETSKKEK